MHAGSIPIVLQHKGAMIGLTWHSVPSDYPLTMGLATQESDISGVVYGMMVELFLKVFGTKEDNGLSPSTVVINDLSDLVDLIEDFFHSVK